MPLKMGKAVHGIYPKTQNVLNPLSKGSRREMKKIISLIGALVIIIALFSACGKQLPLTSKELIEMNVLSKVIEKLGEPDKQIDPFYHYNGTVVYQNVSCAGYSGVLSVGLGEDSERVTIINWEYSRKVGQSEESFLRERETIEAKLVSKLDKEFGPHSGTPSSHSFRWSGISVWSSDDYVGMSIDYRDIDYR